jgi:Peptidase M10 serralysin C terminal
VTADFCAPRVKGKGMITAAEIQTIRNADPGALLPGIDTQTGNPDAVSSLKSYTTLPQNDTAPVFYTPSRNAVYVTQNGAVLKGINFGTASLNIGANNVTIEDCTFTGTTGYWAIRQQGYDGATIENCTFQGSKSPTEDNDWILSDADVTIKNNSFLDSPGDAVDISRSAIAGGVISGNYFTGAGYNTYEHADAIWVTDSTEPLSITNNLIDGTLNPGQVNALINSDIRLTGEDGSLSNVTVSRNFLIGGGENFEVGTEDNNDTISNISITNNFVGYGFNSVYYPGTENYAAVSGNTIVDYTNPVYSSKALAAYEKASLPTKNVVTATTAGENIVSTSSAPTTLLGNGLAKTLTGSTNETNFVPGFGHESLFGGQGANVFTYLSIGDSPINPNFPDGIVNFDPGKDVIDLSRIDANITMPGLQQFTFIGSAPFSGDGGQVRYQLDPAADRTYVQADLVGDSSADFEIILSGLTPLSASNFALTPAQSVADIANGAALTETKVQTVSGAPTEYVYTNVKGRSYSSYESFYGGTGYENIAAEDLNLSSTADHFVLYSANLTLTRGGGAERFQVGTGAADGVIYHRVQSIDATTSGSEHFVFGTGFGSETIQGFAASGTTPDAIQLATSSFSYLTAAMTQAQDLAAVLAHASSGASGLTIADSHGDSLTLAGLTAATITANPSVFHFA